MQDIVHALEAAGFRIRDPNWFGWAVWAESERFEVRCDDCRNDVDPRDLAAGWRPGIEPFVFLKRIADEDARSNARLNLVQAEELAGLRPKSVPAEGVEQRVAADLSRSCPDVEELRVRLGRLVGPLDTALRDFDLQEESALLDRLEPIRFPNGR